MLMKDEKYLPSLKKAEKKLPSIEKQLQSTNASEVLEDGFLKLIWFVNAVKERIQVLITAQGMVSHSVHAHLFRKFLEASDEDFIGAGELNRIHEIEFSSGTCLNKYGRDRPEDKEEQRMVLSKTVEALNQLSKEILEEPIDFKVKS